MVAFECHFSDLEICRQGSSTFTLKGEQTDYEKHFSYINTKLSLFEHHVPGTSLDTLQVLTPFSL